MRELSDMAVPCDTKFWEGEFESANSAEVEFVDQDRCVSIKMDPSLVWLKEDLHELIAALTLIVNNLD